MKDADEIPQKVVIRFLFQRLMENKKWILFSALMVLIAAGVQVFTSTMVKKFFDEALVPKDWNKVLWFCGALVIMFLADGSSDFLHRFTIRIAMERTVRKLRNDLFQRFLVFSNSQHATLSSGLAVNSFTADIQVLGVGTHIVADLLREPVVFLALLGYLFYLNWQLTLVCFLAAPFIALIGKGLGKSAKRNQARLQHSLEHITSHVIETLGGLKTAHSLNQTSLLEREMGLKTQEAYGYLVRLARTEEIVGPSTKWFTSWVGAALIGFGGYMVVTGKLTAGGLAGFITAAGLLQQPIRQLNHVGVRVQQLAAAGRRLYQILYAPLDPISRAQEDILRHHKLPDVPTAHSRLEFRRVSFRYPARPGESATENWTVRDVSFAIGAGQKVALVGRSGSGKTTLSQLALRFHDCLEGEVILNGRNSREWELAEYRSFFSYVSQDVFLFNRSVKENLLFAKPGATNEELANALRSANIQDFIHSLPQGIETVIGERASTLSGGEKQRLAIARAFLRNAPVLILDEATSQLDAHSEKAVQVALNELIKNRSTLVIAHRLSTIRNVDEVLVMDHGQIIERGPPDQLLNEKQGAFAELWKSQHSNHENPNFI